MALDVHPQVLRAFVAVLDTGSFTAASEQLGFTQSALSKQIGTLEAAAGVRLFRRVARGVEPTPAAVQLARRATAILDQLDGAARDLDDLARPLGGRVSLGGFPTAAMRLVPEAIAAVRREHPSVEVTFVASSTPVQVRRLRAGRLDLALLAGGTGLQDWDLDGIASERLPAGPLHVVMSDRHRLARERSVHVTELGDEGWIVGRGARGEPQFGVWPTLVDARVVAELGEWSTRLGFVAAGLGITTVPRLVASSLPPGVVAVTVEDPAWRGRSMRLAHRGDLGGAAAAVRAALRSVAADLAGTPAG